MTRQNREEIEQAGMALIGGVAGLAIWFLTMRLPDLIDSERLVLALSAISGGFFSVLMLAWGPLRLRRALAVAAGIGLVAGGMLAWGAIRFDTVNAYLSTGHVVVAFLVLVTLPVPFLIAAARPDEGWRCYPALFHHAWRLAVRYLAALIFAQLFWGLILLSDQVLQIVGIDAISRLLKVDWVPWVLSGLMLGLGLAVAHQLRAYVSPYLALRLLRLMLPFVLAVSAVFLVAAPLRGLSALFGSLSPAAVLMALAGAAVTLITAVLDAGPQEAARSRVLTVSARLMALLLPLLGGLAAWAVWLRVAEYGWTPRRLAAAVSALVVLGYGGSYAMAALRPGDWMARIRQANIGMALAMIGLAVLWLSPALDAERISANAQLARFEKAHMPADQLDLWAIGHEWGRAGQAVLARLSEPSHPRAAELAPVLARLGAARDRREWQRGQPGAAVEDTEALRRRLRLYPAGATLPEAFFRDDRVPLWRDGCRRTTPAGNPGCVALVADFLPDRPGQEVAVFYLITDARAGVDGWAAGDGYFEARLFPQGAGGWAGPEIIDRIGQGAFSLDSPDPFLLMGEKVLRLQ